MKRQDGTYRAWCRNARDEVLQAGETWEELAVMPTITPSHLSAGEIDTAATKATDDNVLLKAAVLYLRDQLNVIRAALPSPLAPLTLAEVRQGVIDKYKALM